MNLANEAGASTGDILLLIYATLLDRFGPQGWWPARTRWEIIWGAILTQNTTWQNARLALRNLRKAGRLAWSSMRRVTRGELEQMIRPAGFYRQKAATLHRFIQWMERKHKGSLGSLFALGAARAREQLLAQRGIGPETADAILLYAGRQPVFVADAYTRRILRRHNLVPSQADYASTQSFLHQHLPADEALFNEFHALLVEAAKRYCHRKVARCEECPLGSFLEKPSAINSKPLAVEAFVLAER